jgi:hypothetical protein
VQRLNRSGSRRRRANERLVIALPAAGRERSREVARRKQLGCASWSPPEGLVRRRVPEDRPPFSRSATGLLRLLEGIGCGQDSGLPYWQGRLGWSGPVTGADGEPRPWQNTLSAPDYQILQCRGADPRLGPTQGPRPPVTPGETQGRGRVPEEQSQCRIRGSNGCLGRSQARPGRMKRRGRSST